MADFPANIPVTFEGQQYDVVFSGDATELASLANSVDQVPSTDLYAQYAAYLAYALQNPQAYPIDQITVTDSSGNQIAPPPLPPRRHEWNRDRSLVGVIATIGSREISRRSAAADAPVELWATPA